MLTDDQNKIIDGAQQAIELLHIKGAPGEAIDSANIIIDIAQEEPHGFKATVATTTGVFIGFLVGGSLDILVLNACLAAAPSISPAGSILCAYEGNVVVWDFADGVQSVVEDALLDAMDFQGPGQFTLEDQQFLAQQQQLLNELNTQLDELETILGDEGSAVLEQTPDGTPNFVVQSGQPASIEEALEVLQQLINNNQTSGLFGPGSQIGITDPTGTSTYTGLNLADGTWGGFTPEELASLDPANGYLPDREFPLGNGGTVLFLKPGDPLLATPDTAFPMSGHDPDLDPYARVAPKAIAA